MAKLTRIETTDDIDPWFEKSNQRPVFIFKHSLICPISSRAYEQYCQFIDAEADGEEIDVEFALVEVQRARDVSKAIAERTRVRHESPQALLLRGGDVTWHASHGAIREDSLRAALEG